MKQIAALAAGLCVAAMLSGCGLKDGSYSASLAAPDSLGYQAYLKVTVTDGEITEADFDAANADGQKKSEDEDYAALMEPACQTTPAQVSQHYRQLLLGAKSYSKVEVDAVSGATVSSGEFRRLWAALEEPFKKGDTQPITLSPAPEFSSSQPGE